MGRLVIGWVLGLVLVGSTGAQEPRFVLSGHLGRVEALAFSPDGQVLASGATDHSIRVWDLATGTLSVFRNSEGAIPAEMLVGVSVESVVFAPDPPADPLRLGARKTVPHRKLAVIGIDRSLTLWDVTSGRILSRLESQAKPLVGVSYDAQGRMMAAASWDAQAGSRLWEVGSGIDRAMSPAYVPLPRSVSMSPDGRLIVSGDYNGLITARDVVHHKVAAVVQGHQDTVWVTSFSPDGKLLATGGGGGWLRLWDVKDGKPRTATMAHPGGIRVLAFSPDGKTLATGGVDQTAKVWDLATLLESAGPSETVPPEPEPVSPTSPN